MLTDSAIIMSAFDHISKYTLFKNAIYLDKTGHISNCSNTYAMTFSRYSHNKKKLHFKAISVFHFSLFVRKLKKKVFQTEEFNENSVFNAHCQN